MYNQHQAANDKINYPEIILICKHDTILITVNIQRNYI